MSHQLCDRFISSAAMCSVDWPAGQVASCSRAKAGDYSGRKDDNLWRVCQTERKASCGGSPVSQGGCEMCFGLFQRGKKLTIGKEQE